MFSSTGEKLILDSLRRQIKQKIERHKADLGNCWEKKQPNENTPSLESEINKELESIAGNDQYAASPEYGI